MRNAKRVWGLLGMCTMVVLLLLTLGACKDKTEPAAESSGNDEETVVHTHTLVKTEAKKATCEAGGNEAYWTCTECQKVYSDETASKEISVAEAAVAKLEHEYTYTADGAVITKSCVNGCESSQTVTLQAAENLVYDGTEKSIEVIGTMEGETIPAIVYEGDRINAGEFSAKLTVGGATAEVKATIARRDVTGATVGDFAAMTYNGEAQTPVATVTVAGMTVTGSWSSVTNVSDQTTFTASGNFSGTIADVATEMVKAEAIIAVKDGASLNKYWNDDPVDLSALLDIPSGAGAITYTLTSSPYNRGSISGSVLTCGLVGEYAITVTTAENDNYTAGSFSFTYEVKTDPATGDFDGEGVTL